MALLYEYQYWTGKVDRMGPSELVGTHKKKKEVSYVRNLEIPNDVWHARKGKARRVPTRTVP